MEQTQAIVLDDSDVNEHDGNISVNDTSQNSEIGVTCQDSRKKEKVYYTIVEGGSKRGRPKLFASNGYSYCIRDQSVKRTLWTCSVRGKTNPCFARVIQTGEKYEQRQPHNHDPEKMVVSTIGQQQRKKTRPKPSEDRKAARNLRKEAFKPGSDKLVSCKIVEGGTKRGRPMLFDSVGYSYSMRVKRNDATFWTCTIRRKGYRCPASMIQYGEGESASFVKGIHEHNHQVDKSSKKVVEMSLEVKKRAVAEPFKSTLQIVKEVYSQDEEVGTSLPKVASMAHTASHFRRSSLPKEPKTLDFDLVKSAIPTDFLLKDIKVENYRHMVFATADQLNILSSVSSWYLSETNMLVKSPFTRLLTIGAFVTRDGQKEPQQTPLVYCIMSKHREQDFKAVFEAVQKSLTDVKVELIVAGFVKGMWKVLEGLFPTVKLQGCPVSFGLAIHQRLKTMDLEDEYSSNAEFNEYVRKLKSLPFLHSEHVNAEFMFLRSQGEDASVRGLINFVDDTWILNKEWNIPKWTVFKTLVRIKEDSEGWRKRIGHKARCGHCHFYQLVGLLHREAELISPTSCQVVTDDDVRCNRKQHSKSLQSSLESIWDQYETSLTIDEITTKIANLLR